VPDVEFARNTKYLHEDKFLGADDGGAGIEDADCGEALLSRRKGDLGCFRLKVFRSRARLDVQQCRLA
jgi:hypothetical protein